MSGLGQRIKCRWCGGVRHLRPGHVLLCEECDRYKLMVAPPEPPKKRRWWQRRA